eukprot:6134637-Pyramimonas_sp.AAC.1
MDVRGTGAPAFRKELFSQQEPCISVPGLVCGGNAISVVRSSLHLGSVLDDKGPLGPEITYRDREASGAMKTLRKATSKAPGKDMAPKLIFLDSLSLNAATYASGA